MLRHLLVMVLSLAPASVLADGTKGEPPSLRAPGDGCSSPWLHAASPVSDGPETAAVLRLALHRCVAGPTPAPRRALRRT